MASNNTVNLTPLPTISVSHAVDDSSLGQEAKPIELTGRDLRPQIHADLRRPREFLRSSQDPTSMALCDAVEEVENGFEGGDLKPEEHEEKCQNIIKAITFLRDGTLQDKIRMIRAISPNPDADIAQVKHDHQTALKILKLDRLAPAAIKITDRVFQIIINDASIQIDKTVGLVALRAARLRHTRNEAASARRRLFGDAPGSPSGTDESPMAATPPDVSWHERRKAAMDIALGTSLPGHSPGPFDSLRAAFMPFGGGGERASSTGAEEETRAAPTDMDMDIDMDIDYPPPPQNSPKHRPPPTLEEVADSLGGMDIQMDDAEPTEKAE